MSFPSVGHADLDVTEKSIRLQKDKIIQEVKEVVITEVTQRIVLKWTSEIEQYVDFTALAPHLFIQKLLSLDEFLELLDEGRPTAARVQRLLAIFKTKGLNCAKQFFESLASTSEHPGHGHLLNLLSMCT